MREGRAFIDDISPPGSYRAAIDPDAWCKGCGQTLCDCPDAIYQGVAPPLNVAAPRHDAGAPAADCSFHQTGDSGEAQHNHAA